MQMLYDSDNFVVVHNPPIREDEDPDSRTVKRQGFELVNKKSNMTLYITDSWAEAFQRQINAWQLNIPTQDEVEEVLEAYTVLAQQPLVMH